jgi:hypothetical protein
MKHLRIQIVALLLPLLFVMSSCGGYDDGPTTYYSYEQYLRFDDTNEVILAIYYPDANLVDSINAKVAKLKISDNFPTKVELRSEHFLNYSFTFNKKFSYDKGSYNGVRNRDYERTYKGFEVQESNALETKVVNSSYYDYSRSGSWSYFYVVKDEVVVK